MFLGKVLVILGNVELRLIMASGYVENEEIHDEQVSQLYREIRNSLRSGRGVYAVDDYLSSIPGIERIPTKFNSGTACFVVNSGDSTRSVTYLLNASRALRPMRCPRSIESRLSSNSYLNLIASNLLSACLAMKKVGSNRDRALPINVYFVLVENGGNELGYQRFNPRFLRESVLGTIGSGTHLVVVESTGLRACIVQKGCVVFTLEIGGRSHHPCFPWLGENPWDVLIRFEESLAATVKPRHDIYPVEVGKAPPMTLSNFLIGCPTMTPVRLEFHPPLVFGESSSIEAEYYVCIPPEFSHKEFEEKVSAVTTEVAKHYGCKASVSIIYEEEPFREDAKSVLVRATINVFQKLTDFEPVIEWLPYPVSGKDLISSGFARDLIVVGPGDWTMASPQDEKKTIMEAFRASDILAEIPYGIVSLTETLHTEQNR